MTETLPAPSTFESRRIVTNATITKSKSAEAAAAERFGFDPYRLVFMIARHARAVERVDADGGKT